MAEEKYTVSGKVKFTEDTQPAFNKVKTNLREMGEKVSALGMRMTGAFTLPVVGVIAGMTKMGAAASKTVKDLAGNQAAIEALDPAIRSLAKSYDEMEAMIAPVRAEFQGMAATLMGELVPILRELMPTIKSVVGEIGGMVKAFASMPIAQQQTILALVGVAAAAGPVVSLFGQVLWTIGTIQGLIPGFTAALGTIGPAAVAAAGPVGVLAAAIAGLIALLNSEAGKDAVNSAKILAAGFAAGGQFVVSGGDRGKTLAMFAKVATDLGAHGTLPPGRAMGGPVMAGMPYLVGERGPEPFIPSSNGTILPNSSLGTTVIINYSPAVALTARDEAETVLGPMIANYLHKAGR